MGPQELQAAWDVSTLAGDEAALAAAAAGELPRGTVVAVRSECCLLVAGWHDSRIYSCCRALVLGAVMQIR